jgi:dTDP-glucose 4,6-dehydratase
MKSQEAKQMRVLITGGAGFIGSHLCDRLLSQGHLVIAMDNLSTGSIDNIAHLAGNDHFMFIKHDVTHYVYVPGPLDAVLHLASLPSPVDYLEKPIQTLKVGALGTHKTLGLAKEKRCRYLLASTSEVYGDPQVHPQPESYWGHVNPVGPRGVYDESKRFAEAMAMAYHRHHGIETRIARIFNTYGPRMRIDDGRVVPNFVKQALLGQPLTVYGDGLQTRSFCYVSDLVDGIVRLLMSDEVEPVNLGNPEEYTIHEFAKLVNELARNKAGIAFIGRSSLSERVEDDPKMRRPDITKAKTLLGWEPQVDVRTGLCQTIEYLRAKGIGQ